MTGKEREVLRNLASQFAEIASMPIQKVLKRQWKALNALKPERPMFTIDQVPWHEMEIGNELTLQCNNKFLRQVEEELRRRLYIWNYMRDDFVFEPHINIPMSINGFNYGLEVSEELAKTDEANDIVSHEYIDQLQTESDLFKLKKTIIELDENETSIREDMAHEIFDGILEVRMDGYTPAFNIWDIIVQWRGVNQMLYDFIDRPDFMHQIMSRITDLSLDMLDQLEMKGLLGQPQSTIHCSGAWTDELRQNSYNPHPKAKDLWTYGMAQIFSTVSAEMHEEFEINYAIKWYERFGLGYYGCCEPLDKKMDIVRRLPNIRKVAMSPWADINIGAEAIGRDYVLSNKPTPAHLADMWNPEEAKKDVECVLSACEKNGCPVEFLLKDISTVMYQPQNLWKWTDIIRNAIN